MVEHLNVVDVKQDENLVLSVYEDACFFLKSYQSYALKRPSLVVIL